MKSEELQMIKRIAKMSKGIKQSSYKYNRFDAYNHISIFEVKHRNEFYEDVLIEFDKFSYNYAYAMVNKLKFIYAVEMDNVIYLFDIIKLVKNGHNFNWIWKEMPKTTEFNQKEKIQKYVGFLNIRNSDFEL